MNVRFLLMKLAPMGPMAALFGLTAAFPFYAPSVAERYVYPAFSILPYIVLVIVILVGLFFRQARVSCAAVFLAGLFAAGLRCVFAPVRPMEPGTDAALVLAAAVAYPLLTAFLYHLTERGALSPQGVVRLCVTIVVMGLTMLLPHLERFRAAASVDTFYTRPLFGSLGLPAGGFLALALSLPLLLVPRRRESPALGPLLLLSSFFVFGALSFGAPVWQPGQRYMVFGIFTIGAGLALTWVLLESAWRQANADELTGLPTRRPLQHQLLGLGAHYSIAVADIDHFKQINDRHGHDVGDQVLRFVAATIERNGSGRAYRYGGEEFVIVCRGDGSEEHEQAMEALRLAVCGRAFNKRGKDRPVKKPSGRAAASQRRQGNVIPVAVSIGIAHSRPGLSPQEVLDKADKALYRAKRGGRNRVCAG